MSDVVIRAVDLRKVYRLYAKPSYRFRDMFGLLGAKAGAYTEHAALDRVSLEIRRGEKVAIIGRNGAGKSTFLKLVTNVIQATSGTLEVTGNAHALLQIGTGFHPDFTGRENVFAYFAQLGVTGDEAKRRCAEVIEFAELEEYIDQPMKTYSTGMGVRLMFSASTAIKPDLLVLDEVLGVGDAYFAHKSYERIKSLCSADGTTMLLVSHDVYTAAKVCERMIWFDHGRILMDGDGSTVVKAYEDSIRQQEETRLRAKTRERIAQLRAATAASPAENLLVEVRARLRMPQPSPVYFSRIDLVASGETIASLPLAGDGDIDESRPSHLTAEGSCWGEAVTWQGRRARPFLNYGSPFHKVAGMLGVPSLDSLGDDVSIHLTYWSENACDLTLHALTDRHDLSLGALPPSAGAWVDHVARIADALEADGAAVAAVQGTGRILVEHVTVFDARGAESHFLEHGRPASLSLQYRIADETLAEHAQVVVAFHRGGVETACRIIARDLMFDARVAKAGTVTLGIPKLVLGAGEYTVTVMIAAEGYFDRAQTIFYSINPGVYCCLNRVVEIAVTGGGIIAGGTAFVGEGAWTIAAAPDPIGTPAVESHQ